jgi:hypothetical protein
MPTPTKTFLVHQHDCDRTAVVVSDVRIKDPRFRVVAEFATRNEANYAVETGDWNLVNYKPTWRSADQIEADRQADAEELINSRKGGW